MLRMCETSVRSLLQNTAAAGDPARSAAIVMKHDYGYSWDLHNTLL